MFENDADTNSSPSQNNDTGSYFEYLSRAAQACAAGDVVLGLHLYLAAYERSVQDSYVPDPVVIDGLRQAWKLACQHKERSLAEYIFEKLEPYLSAEEIAQYAAQLQKLALDKLEEFGLTREDLEDMTDMISNDFFGIDPSSFFMRVESGTPSSGILGPLQKGLVRAKEAIEAPQVTDEVVMSEVANEAATPVVDVTSDVVSDEPAVSDKPDTAEATAKTDTIEATDKPDTVEATAKPDTAEATANGEVIDTLSESAASGQVQPVDEEVKAENTEAAKDHVAEAAENKQDKAGETSLSSLLLPTLSSLGERKSELPVDAMTYKDLIGYETAIGIMRGYGIGMQDDVAFKELVKTLNARHGLSRVPVSDAFLFRAPVREDANQFMVATMGEISLPAIRMRMEENFQGMPVLCVMASSDNQPRLNTARNAIEGGGVLILEDIDLWGSPLSEAGNEEMGGFVFAQLSRGAREAINLIRSAVENPDVYVFVSAAQDSQIDPFFHDLLEPLTVVDIELPNEAERNELWLNIAKEHPSLYAIDRESLVKYSAGMSRYDIYMAAREAVEEAYKASLVARAYIPVTKENVFEKIALYQPLESDEYLQLENAVVDSFKTELEKLDDLLNDQGEKRNK